MKREIPKHVRQLCYERDSFTCQAKDCHQSLSTGAILNLHHILPEQFGGKETPDNLITLCNICHKKQHIEFSAYYPDSESILHRMNYLLKGHLSRLRNLFQVDDGCDLLPHLKFLAGKDASFRQGQLATIRAARSGENVLLVTPTGTGKSVCYQLPGLLATQPSLVICPLKALMKDQVESIWAHKITATYINSDLSAKEKDERYKFIKQQLYKFILVAPERFHSSDKQLGILYQDYAHLVIDEAHVIDRWGMDFRPAYRKLGQLRRQLKNPPVIALTATASKQTQQKILTSLEIPDAKVIVTGFHKKNIHITTRQLRTQKEKYRYISDLIKRNPNDKIIIFVLTRKTGQELLDNLIPPSPRASSMQDPIHIEDIPIEFFHGQLEDKERMRIHNMFTGVIQPGLRVLISTSAFGMGINIANIRHVVHLAPALSLIDYVQQIGRAGRDGKQSYAHLLYQSDDRGLLDYMLTQPLKDRNYAKRNGYTDEDVIEIRENSRKEMGYMLNLIQQPPGREWPYILDYFGEEQPSLWQDKGKLFVDIGLSIFLILVGTFLLLAIIDVIGFILKFI